jgi:hypothetical protein
VAPVSQWQGRRSQSEATRPSDGSTRTLEASRKDAASGESSYRKDASAMAASDEIGSRRLGSVGPGGSRKAR